MRALTVEAQVTNGAVPLVAVTVGTHRLYLRISEARELAAALECAANEAETDAAAAVAEYRRNLPSREEVQRELAAIIAGAVTP